MEEDTIELGKSIKIAGLAGGIGLVLLILIFIQYSMVKNREGRIVLPAGDTYLGPSPTPDESQTQVTNDPPPVADVEKFTASADEAWITHTGTIYPYSFQAPQSLTLVTFDDDPYDIFAIDWNNLSPSSNVLVGVDNLQNDEDKTKYINVNKRQYVEEWWKQFGGLTGVQSITDFTTSNGYKGYRAHYLNQNNQSPFVDVFITIPDRPEIVIHLANGVLDDGIFERLVDSIIWGDAQATPDANNSEEISDPTDSPAP